MQSLQTSVASLEESDTALLEAYNQIKQMCQDHELGTISEYDALSEKYKQELSNLTVSIKDIKAQIIEASRLVKKRQKTYEEQKLFTINTLMNKQS